MSCPLKLEGGEDPSPPYRETTSLGLPSFIPSLFLSSSVLQDLAADLFLQCFLFFNIPQTKSYPVTHTSSSFSQMGHSLLFQCPLDCSFPSLLSLPIMLSFLSICFSTSVMLPSHPYVPASSVTLLFSVPCSSLLSFTWIVPCPHELRSSEMHVNHIGQKGKWRWAGLLEWAPYNSASDLPEEFRQLLRFDA